MRSSIAKVTSAAFLAGVALFGAAGTAAAHECHHFPHGALAVGGDAIDVGDDAAALAVGGDAIAKGDKAKHDKDDRDEKGDRDEGAKALAVGGDAVAVGDDAAALAVGGDAIAIGKDHDEDEDCD